MWGPHVSCTSFFLLLLLFSFLSSSSVREVGGWRAAGECGDGPARKQSGTGLRAKRRRASAAEESGEAKQGRRWDARPEEGERERRPTGAGASFIARQCDDDPGQVEVLVAVEHDAPHVLPIALVHLSRLLRQRACRHRLRLCELELGLHAPKLLPQRASVTLPCPHVVGWGDDVAWVGDGELALLRWHHDACTAASRPSTRLPLLRCYLEANH